MENGCLDVLNCGAGHLQIKFEKANDADRDKARRMITDMLKRGYALFVEIEGALHRVQAFDPERAEYILKDPEEISGDEPAAQVPPSSTTKESHESTQATEKETPVTAPRKGRRLAMGSARATGIAPTAGG